MRSAFLRRVRFLWEPRGAWPDEVVLDLCRELRQLHGWLPADPETDAYPRA